MRLSKLHIAGFKSFPDRAELGFDQGVTAIVGPNGCGKSNVVDAITWVLGEQSAKSLRGERMEDVIFSGSDARKPTASAEVRLKLSQVAQVAMLAATDESEPGDEQPLMVRDVEIGRRVYRSGESEYLIDGEVCRLKDVHELLMDSGLGVKAYAVIEQGKIGQILASRPAERRMLIEEAAGVTKYKSRRRAAELKLDAAEQNLTRVDDIIFEVEKQRGQLKRQASRARRYKKLREELRKWEQVQFAHRYETLAREVHVAEGRLEEARIKAAAEAARVAEFEAAIEAVRLSLTEGESAATSARERAHAHDLEIGRQQQQVQFDKQQIAELTRQADVYTLEVQELDARRAPADEAIAAQQAAAREATDALAAARADVDAREAEYARTLTAVQAVEQESDATRAAVLSANTTLAALRQARDHAAAVRDRVAAELERFEVEARELAADAERVLGHREGSARSLEETRTAREQLQARRSEVQASLVARRADRERVASTLGERQRDVAGKDARLRSLQQLDASRATFGDAARFLLADNSHAIRKHGAVADHLAVERSFERAVEAVLGDLLQYVVVEQHDDVAVGLRLLNDKKVGRCGFVVLDNAPLSADASARDLPAGVRELRSVVAATGPHADALSGLLANAFVAESFEAAQAFARTVSGPVATPTGEVFRGCLVQGGSRQAARGILETRAEIAALRTEVDDVNQAIATLKDEQVAVVAAITADEQALAVVVAELHEREKAIVGLEAQARNAADEQARVNRRLDVVGTERARAAEAQAAAEQRREDASAAIEEHDVRQREAEANLAAVFAQLQSAREQAEAKLRLVTEGRTTQATMIERASALATQVARLEESRRELETRVVARTAEIQRIETRREELRASIIETGRLIDENVQLLDGLRTEIQGLDERVVSLRAEFSERDQAIRGARHSLDGVRTQVTGLEVSLARAAADLTHLETACVEAVGLSLPDVVTAVAALDAAGELVPPGRRAIMAVADEEEDAEAGAPVEVAAADGDAAVDAESVANDPAIGPDEVIVILRKRIERLGPVNMMAIEQFDELESRHTFLTTQRADLLESIAQTGEAIKKIDKTTRERFAEAFVQINQNFEKTFTTLFGGGRAGLVLIDQENDAESGIDIIAQPPGKRLQNVQLLSGGEKALTAMALMFAVFKYRPSPFCLLDEIDAPLDDANIGRFVEMLQSMQDNTQFILITHHRKTMEIADRLYGVTMEEPGVSKLISVQLN